MYRADGTGYNIHTGMYRSSFPGLEVMVDSHDFRYQNLGTVENVHDTGRDIFRKFSGERGVEEYERLGGGRNAAGMMCSHTTYTNNGPVTQAHSFYEPQRTGFLDDFVSLHEQVHGLHAGRNVTDIQTGKQYTHGIMLLEEQMRSDGYDTSALESYRDFHKLRNKKGEEAKEFVANFGAFYRMSKMGYSDEELERHAMTYNASQMREAHQAFKAARAKQPQTLPRAAPSLEDRVGGAARPAAGPTMPLLDPALGGAGIGSRGVREYSLYDVLMEFFQLLRWYMRSYTNEEQKPYSTRGGGNRQMGYAGGYA